MTPTNPTPSDLAALAKGLTKAQRALILRIDDRVWSLSEAHYMTRKVLFARGFIAEYRAAGHRFFSLTDLGLHLRSYLQESHNDRD